MSATSGETKPASKGRSVTLLFVSLCFIFFLTMSPVSIYQIWYPYRINEISAMADPYARNDAKQYMLFQGALVDIVSYINASTNFLLYVFNGSKFRRELKALFYCKTSNQNIVFGPRSRKSSTPYSQVYILQSSANVSKLSSEQNQSANNSKIVSDSVSIDMHLDRIQLSCKDVHTDNDGQCQLNDTTNNGHVYFNNALNSDDGINQVSITCPGSNVKEPTEIISENDSQTITTIADIVTENDPNDVSMST